MDEVGAYWRMITSGLESEGGPGPAVAHWRSTFGLFGKHVQDEIATEEDAAWLLELLVTIFGSKEAVRRDHPFSVLFCPVSPLAMEAEHTDAWLATAGWDIPIAIMPMPMMGTSAPTGLRSTIVSGNAEVLGAIVLAQAASQGTPVIYAPALATMEPRTGRWGGGGPEHSLLGAATTEMARFYGLPVIASNGGTDHFVTGVQAAYERTLNWTLPVLSWPDIMIGPGSLGGATTLCLEQMVIDVEVYRMCRRLHQGIGAGVGETDVLEALDEVGPVGDFLARTQTRDAVRGGEWFMPRLGSHATFDRWEAAGKPDVVGQARDAAMSAIAGHQPLPFPDEVAAALATARAGSTIRRPGAEHTGVGRDALRGGIPERGRAGARPRGVAPDPCRCRHQGPWRRRPAPALRRRALRSTLEGGLVKMPHRRWSRRRSRRRPGRSSWAPGTRSTTTRCRRP